MASRDFARDVLRRLSPVRHGFRMPVHRKQKLAVALRRYGTRTSSPIRNARLQGEPMSIRWNDDIDNVLRDASGSGKPILLDFSAAPM
jgi:hypothetical protein